MKPKRFNKNYWEQLWLQFESSATLHRASVNVQENRNSKWVVRNFTGTTVCGKNSSLLWFPGIGSQLAAPRCRTCCKVVGVPFGKGNPYNDGIAETKA